MIDPNKPFALYANCEVRYSGRADSYLEAGRYLIIHKEDGTLLIHNAIKNPPRNYQGPGAKLTILSNKLISKRKAEIIEITIHDIIHYIPLAGWSNSGVSISKTERDLVNKLFLNWYDYIQADLELIYIEYQNDLGVIDMLGIDANNVHHVIEAKRITASLSHCSQLKRYLEYFNEHNVETVGYIASPKIGVNALNYLHKHGCKWIEIQF